jgi:hypothetical protein
VVQVRKSEVLREAARELVGRAVDFWKVLDRHRAELERPMPRGGRKAQPLDA